MADIYRFCFILLFLSAIRCAVVLQYQDKEGKLTVEADSKGGATELVNVDLGQHNNEKEVSNNNNKNNGQYFRGKSGRIKTEKVKPATGTKTVEVMSYVSSPKSQNFRKNPPRNQPIKDKRNDELVLKKFAESLIAVMLKISDDRRDDLQNIHFLTTAHYIAGSQDMANFYVKLGKQVKRRIVDCMMVAQILTDCLRTSQPNIDQNEASFSQTGLKSSDSTATDLINALLSRLGNPPCLNEFVFTILGKETDMKQKDGQCSYKMFYTSLWYKNNCRILIEGGNAESRSEVDLMCNGDLGVEEVASKGDNEITKVIGDEKGDAEGDKNINNVVVNVKSDEGRDKVVNSVIADVEAAEDVELFDNDVAIAHETTKVPPKGSDDDCDD